MFYDTLRPLYTILKISLHKENNSTMRDSCYQRHPSFYVVSSIDKVILSFFAPTWDIRLDNDTTAIKATKVTLYDKANVG